MAKISSTGFFLVRFNSSEDEADLEEGEEESGPNS
jgi:hypothetical protein